MILTSEQQAIIHHRYDLVVKAGAGAAKTTTLIEYAKARPNARILYLAFNKAIKTEAIEKFKKAGVENVTIHTAHSLAYKNSPKMKVCTGFSLTEIIEICNIKSESGDTSSEFILAKLINDSLTIFCNKAENSLNENDLLLNFDKKLVEQYYDYILKGVQVMTSKMVSGKIPFIHDYYLKRYQMSQPKLPFTHILFDEGQDASPVMLDIFTRQNHATKIIVGDEAQAIYGFRKAVNALSQVEFEELTLRKSFRFGESNAAMANNILSWKKKLGLYEGTIQIQGVGGTTDQNTVAHISRSNFGVLKSAILATEQNKYESICFEGGIKGYSFLGGGNNLIYDLMALNSKKQGNIKSDVLRKMGSLQEAIKYAESVGDKELLNASKIVQAYGGSLFHHIKHLKSISTTDRSKADAFFSTVHKCKGLEYDAVYLSGDFTELKDVILFAEHYNDLEFKDVHAEKARLQMNEEINALYVGVTRSKNIVKKSWTKE